MRFAGKDDDVQSQAEQFSYLDGFDLVDRRLLSPPLEARGLRVQPKKGNAIIWYSRRPDGQIDPASQHTGCPLLRGKKWTIVNWMHFEGTAKTRGCGEKRQRPCMLNDYSRCNLPERPKTCAVFTEHAGQDPFS